MPRVTLTAVPHSFLSNCPETDPPRHVRHGERDNAWGTSQLQQPRHRRSTFFCMVGRSTSPWCRGGGLDSVSPPSRAVPPSVPARLRVWHLQKQRLETLLAALLLQGQGPKQAQSQSKKTKQHFRAFGKTQGVLVPFSQTRGWDSTIRGSEGQHISRIYMR